MIDPNDIYQTANFISDKDHHKDISSNFSSTICELLSDYYNVISDMYQEWSSSLPSFLTELEKTIHFSLENLQEKMFSKVQSMEVSEYLMIINRQQVASRAAASDRAAVELLEWRVRMLEEAQEENDKTEMEFDLLREEMVVMFRQSREELMKNYEVGYNQNK
eukprot:Tbor_TRINITY_DN5775_c0_g1::TRINITY_DN5775_c0_g1_i1::g.20346::m.20346